jgi:hypothetical protein
MSCIQAFSPLLLYPLILFPLSAILEQLSDGKSSSTSR